MEIAGGSGIAGRLSTTLLRRISAAVALIAAAGFGLYVLHNGQAGSSAAEAGPPAFVGSETCAGCHQAQAELWRASQHNHAMAHATAKSVLGDFNDASFDYHGIRSRFFRDGEKFLVETDGADGQLQTFQVKYTFGVEPLQQYLVEFPDGRVQALPIAWDTRPKDKGGQRWFHIYPDENIQHDDVLHWTKLNQNWNFMCAECHSTGVRRNYDAAQNRFATQFAEISVGCEACHGRGSAHVAWAKQQQSWWPFGRKPDASQGLPVRFDERRDIVWRHDAKSGNPQRNFTPPLLRKEVETCGLCHARRAQFSEDWIPGHWLSDTHMVTPLTRGLYEADGQMRDVEETYNYGPFKQSRMFAAGVTCSDCHEPHSAKLRASGDAVCTQCHAPERYAAAAHSHHEAAAPPVGCVSCHMPAHSYMVVDRRHDHSLRVPRPDLTVKLGTPNACNDCHADKSAAWAAEQVEKWYGPDREGLQKYGAAFRRGLERPKQCRPRGGGRRCRSAGVCARQRARRSAGGGVGQVRRADQGRARRSRSDGADRHDRDAGQFAAGSSLAAGVAAVVGFEPRRPHRDGRSVCRRAGREPAGGRSRPLRCGGRGIHRGTAPQRRPPRSALDARKLLGAPRPPR